MTRAWHFDTERPPPPAIGLELVEPSDVGDVACPFAFQQDASAYCVLDEAPPVPEEVASLALDETWVAFAWEDVRREALVAREAEVDLALAPVLAPTPDVAVAPLALLAPLEPESQHVVTTPGQPAVCGACLHRHAQLREDLRRVAAGVRCGHGACDVCGHLRWRFPVELQGVAEARAARVARPDENG